MIHTLMEVDSHPCPSSSSPSRLRGPSGLSLATFRQHHPTRMKRERSPEAGDAGADRPSKRVANEHILATSSSSGNSSRQHSEDWVKQAGGLRIDSSAGGNYLFASLTQGVGPGPSASTQVDEDFAMADEETAGVDKEGQENPASAQHRIQLILPQRSHSLPNQNLPRSCHPYGQHWVQQRVRNADGSPLINVLPATPADSQQSLSMTEAPAGHGPPFTQNHMLQAHHVPSGTPPPSDSTGMSISTPPLVQQDLSPFIHSTGKNKRVAFGPRLDCEKCRQGENHFAHVEYE